jgi:hypothetical protein
MMKLPEALEILRKENAFLKSLPLSSLLWKKAILEFFHNKNLLPDVRKALVTVASTIDDDEVVTRYFDFFNTETDAEVRKLMVEALKDNFHEKVVEHQFPLLGIKEKVSDRYVRQIASQNITNAVKYFIEKKTIRAGMFIARLRNKTLNDNNTFVRMNAAVILRNIGDKRVVPDLENRLAVEKKNLSQSGEDVGIPYVVRELERSIAFLKERA